MYECYYMSARCCSRQRTRRGRIPHGAWAAHKGFPEKESKLHVVLFKWRLWKEGVFWKNKAKWTNSTIVFTSGCRRDRSGLLWAFTPAGDGAGWELWEPVDPACPSLSDVWHKCPRKQLRPFNHVMQLSFFTKALFHPSISIVWWCLR